MSDIQIFPTEPIIGEAISLRPFTDMDFPAICEACNDPEIQRWLPLPSPYDLKDAQFFVNEFAVKAQSSGTGIVFAVEVNYQLVGAIDISGATWSNRVCGIGYWAVPSHRGNGYMTSALELLSNWVIQEQGFQRIEVFVGIENYASQKIAERAGFTREGISRNKAVIRGRRIDVILYSKIPADLDHKP
jgi:RimJ/RimL family protein N-acetyltransferase